MNYKSIFELALQEWKKVENPEHPLILVGASTCGRAAGALEVIHRLEKVLIEKNLKAEIMEVGCIGMCYNEVLMDIIKPNRPRISYPNVTPDTAALIVEEYLLKDNPSPHLALGTIGQEEIEGLPKITESSVFSGQERVVLKNCGYINPDDINHYLGRGGYQGLSKALSMTREEVIAEVSKSGLRGRGGAGFPTGKKWEACYKAPGEEKYVICNADEGDPGAFMDRSVLEGDPHSVIEGMIIAAYAIGSKFGYIYARAEYPLAIKRLKTAISQAKERGFLGKNILGTGLDFDLEIFQGAGAFVCGESTALVLSIEGKRGMPVSLPRPRTTEKGLWDKPTLLNNVKTFASIPQIISHGSDWFKSIGTPNSPGTAIFALAGSIQNCGLIEVPMGISLREVIFDIGGGVPQGKKFKAVQIGGPSGGCLPENLLHLPVDFDSLDQAGAMMGSGGMVVMDESTCMVDIARYFLDFTYKESCGECAPCRLGTKQMLDILTDITQGHGKPGDIELLQELAIAIKSGSICGLGQTAPNPVLTTLQYFLDEYEAHIYEKKCPAKVCKNLISYVILEEKCKACTLCLKACPAEAITGAAKQIHKIDQGKCIKCGVCLEVCPPRFNAVLCFSGRYMEYSPDNNSEEVS